MMASAIESQEGGTSELDFKKQLTSQQSLLYYPEQLHKVKSEDCCQYNARIMKHLMKQKMSKNQTFY